MGRKKIAEALTHDVEVDSEEAVTRIQQIQGAQQRMEKLRELVTDLARRLRAAKADLRQAGWDRDHWMHLGLTRLARVKGDSNGEGGGE